MKVNKNITITKDLNFFYKNKKIFNIKAFSFGIVSDKIQNYLEIEGSKYNDTNWEFAKEMAHEGFHVLYVQDQDMYELYEETFNPKLVYDHNTGKPKNQRSERFCKHCHNKIKGSEPWCLRSHL